MMFVKRSLLSVSEFTLKKIIFYTVFSDGLDPIPSITPQGFQFLLMDIGSQVWYFVLQYLETVEVRCTIAKWIKSKKRG